MVCRLCPPPCPKGLWKTWSIFLGLQSEWLTQATAPIIDILYSIGWNVIFSPLQWSGSYPIKSPWMRWAELSWMAHLLVGLDSWARIWTCWRCQELSCWQGAAWGKGKEREGDSIGLWLGKDKIALEKRHRLQSRKGLSIAATANVLAPRTLILSLWKPLNFIQVISTQPPPALVKRRGDHCYGAVSWQIITFIYF